MSQAATNRHTDMDHACPACIEYLGRRNSECFPTVEEYEAFLERYPGPIWASADEADRAEDEGTFDAAYEESWVWRAPA